MPNNKQVILGMSGGMDSSMTAILLQKQGYTVIGVTLLTFDTAEQESIKAAQNLAHELQIEHHVLDCRATFKTEVIDYFTSDYLNGKTPNPCIRCNETIKWKLLNEFAIKTNSAYIATGHYVQTEQYKNRFYISKGLDPNKDQSYFLWNLDESIIKKALFPLGKLKKSEVRELARSLGYTHYADKKESMGVCFLNGTNYKEFLQKNLPRETSAFKPGIVLNQEGVAVGHHEGFPFYTIGQKKGITNIASDHCVIGINPTNNTLTTGNKELLFCSTTVLHNSSITPQNELWNDEVFIRIRGIDSVPGYFGTIEPLSKQSIKVNFNQPVWALTPGQSIVFYHQNKVIGGGLIS